MMHYLKTFVFVFFTITIHGYAQLDKSKKGAAKGKIIGTIEAPAKELKKPNSLEFDTDNGFKTANQELQQKKKQQKEEEELKNKDILTPELLRELTLKKRAEKFNFNIPMIDKELGSFTTKSKFIYIKAYDFGQLDGDVISIYKNQVLEVDRYTLKNSSKIFKIELAPGINKIEILAFNEGRLRPNTGAFTVYGESKEVVISDMWYLAAGAKVIAHVIRTEE